MLYVLHWYQVLYPKQIKEPSWLLFFYSVPSKPVSNRMRLWRRLSKAGAVQLKGSVYILPDNDENYEFCQWQVSEVTSMGGEGTFVKTHNVETMKNDNITDLFNHQRGKDYRSIEKSLEEIEQKLNSIKKGTRTQDYRKLPEQLNKLIKEFEEVRKIDFFKSRTGDILNKRLKMISEEIKGISGADLKRHNTSIAQKNTNDYQGKKWVTRKRPFVDRMSSAWLIKKFADRDAEFRFIDEKDMEGLDKSYISFDIRDGEFTHIGDNCTFEVLTKAFGIKDPAVRKMAEVVHELDIKDDKFRNPESKGIEEILSGIKKTSKDDSDALAKGMAVFEMLYASKQ